MTKKIMCYSNYNILSFLFIVNMYIIQLKLKKETLIILPDKIFN